MEIMYVQKPFILRQRFRNIGYYGQGKRLPFILTRLSKAIKTTTCFLLNWSSEVGGCEKHFGGQKKCFFVHFFVDIV